MLFTYTLEGSQLRYPGSFSELIEYSICSKLYQHRIHIFAYYACDAEQVLGPTRTQSGRSGSLARCTETTGEALWSKDALDWSRKHRFTRIRRLDIKVTYRLSHDHADNYLIMQITL